MSLEYFGVNLRDKEFGLKMTRENYAIINKNCTNHSEVKDYFEVYWGENKKDKFLKIFEDTSATKYTDSWCEEHKEKVLKNYDLNIEYFKFLDKNDFEIEVNKFLKNNREFKEIKNLNDAYKKSGYYVMILDEYCQMYVGTSKKIKKRIMGHWSKKKQFDRLIFGKVKNSKLLIDSFRAFDTKRVFVYFTGDTYSVEDKYINKIPEKYCCNRTSGGIPEFGALSIIANSKTRDFMEE